MKNEIAIVGYGGRTGTMLAYELEKSSKVLGIAQEKTIEYLRKNNLQVKKENSLNAFNGEVISDKHFTESQQPEILFLATRNPIKRTLLYYLKRCGKKKPIIVLSQNGINALDSIQEIAKNYHLRVVRMVLFNAIDRQGNKISYSEPLQVALSQAYGSKGVNKVSFALEKADFQVDKFSKKNAKNIEFSKLFLNLIGMASASRGLSIKTGFNNKEVFKEEIQSLREYIKVVKRSGGQFLNFKPYPVRFLSRLVFLPLPLLTFFRNKLASFITKDRGNKPKDLGEIDYYNGGVVKLAQKLEEEKKKNHNPDSSHQESIDITRDFYKNVATNQKIYWRAVKRKGELSNL
jgi:ketopantoate reductase